MEEEEHAIRKKKNNLHFFLFEPIGYHNKKEIMRREKRHPANGYEKRKNDDNIDNDTRIFLKNHFKLSSNVCFVCVVCFHFFLVYFERNRQRKRPGRWDRERERKEMFFSS